MTNAVNNTLALLETLLPLADEMPVLFLLTFRLESEHIQDFYRRISVTADTYHHLNLTALTHKEQEYIFKHTVTQVVAYNGLLVARRKALHRTVAETIERLFADNLDELATTLAYHYERAEVRDQATRQYALQSLTAAQNAHMPEYIGMAKGNLAWQLGAKGNWPKRRNMHRPPWRCYSKFHKDRCSLG